MAKLHIFTRSYFYRTIYANHTVRYVCAASASLAIWEDFLRAGLITSTGNRRTMSPLFFWKAVAVGITVPIRD